jgi:hypothetical protein
VKGPARHTYNGKAENVRDVAFNPTFYYEFVAGFENGVIQVNNESYAKEGMRSSYFGR